MLTTRLAIAYTESSVSVVSLRLWALLLQLPGVYKIDVQTGHVAPGHR